MKKTIENLVGCVIVLLMGLAIIYVGNELCQRTWLTVFCTILGIGMCISAVVCAIRESR